MQPRKPEEVYDRIYRYFFRDSNKKRSSLTQFPTRAFMLPSQNSNSSYQECRKLASREERFIKFSLEEFYRSRAQSNYILHKKVNYVRSRLIDSSRRPRGDRYIRYIFEGKKKKETVIYASPGKRTP